MKRWMLMLCLMALALLLCGCGAIIVEDTGREIIGAGECVRIFT